MPDARFWQDLGRLGLGQISFTSFNKFRKQNIVICGLYDKSHEQCVTLASGYHLCHFTMLVLSNFQSNFVLLQSFEICDKVQIKVKTKILKFITQVYKGSPHFVISAGNHEIRGSRVVGTLFSIKPQIGSNVFAFQGTFLKVFR